MNVVRKLSTVDFCAVDLETTGVNPAFNRIVEIGAVRFRLDGSMETFHSLVNPGVPIPENVIKIHGITDSMVASAPLIGAILDGFHDFMESSVLVIQNPGFDLSFIDRAFRSHGVCFRPLWALDTVRLAKKHFTGLPNHKLSTLADHLGLNCRKHRALDDAVVCMKVFLEILRAREIGCNSSLNDIMNLHGEAVSPVISTSLSCTSGEWKRLSIGKRVTIRYKDSDGNITTRSILPREFISYGKKNYILAHCYLRGSERCFMADRIISIE